MKEATLKTEPIESKVYTQVFESMDYDKIKLIKGNRNIRATNYNKLLRSMKEEQLMIPICLNEKYEIIDGQHRFLAAKELNKPFYYYIQEGYKEEQMKRANLVSSTWSKNDFLNLYVNQNDATYCKFQELMDEYHVQVIDLIKIIAAKRKDNLRELGLMFEEGTIIISDDDFEYAEKFLQALDLFNEFRDYNRSKFIAAFLALYNHPNYSHDQMVKKYEAKKERLTPQLSVDLYIELLANKIYSLGSVKNHIFFDPSKRRLYTPAINYR